MKEFLSKSAEHYVGPKDYRKSALKYFKYAWRKSKKVWVNETKEAVSWTRSIKKVFLEIKKETLPQVLSCEFCEISKNTFSYRTPPVAVSETILHAGSVDFFIMCVFLETSQIFQNNYFVTHLRRGVLKNSYFEKQKQSFVDVFENRCS